MTTFRVQVRVSDRWMTIEGAERLPQHEAHAMRAQEAARVGEHRVQMAPNGACGCPSAGIRPSTLCDVDGDVCPCPCHVRNLRGGQDSDGDDFEG